MNHAPDGGPPAGGTPSTRTLTEHDRRRLRIGRRVAFTGLALGLVAAAAVGVLGASGGAGLAVLLVLSSAGCVIAAFTTAAFAMIDEWRREPVARRRAWVALGYALLGTTLLVLSMGAVASA